MKDGDIDPRQKAILHSAWQAFATYGFRKTSMDDIALGAGMSRSALYLHYRNKEDIFRKLAQYYHDEAADAVAAALAGPGSVPEVLAAAFAAQGGAVMEAMLTSPHGMELLDTGATVASDVVAVGERRLAGVYAGWLRQQSGAGRIRLSGTAEDVASTITAALKGIKASCPDYPTYKARVAQLAALIGAGLTAPG